jgi:hypothetical protein
MLQLFNQWEPKQCKATLHQATALSALQTIRQMPLACERGKWFVSPFWEKGFLVGEAVNCCVYSRNRCKFLMIWTLLILLIKEPVHGEKCVKSCCKNMFHCVFGPHFLCICVCCIFFEIATIFEIFIASGRYIFKNWFLWTYFEKLQFIDKTGFPPTSFWLQFEEKEEQVWCAKVSRINSQLKLQSVSPDWRDSLVPILTKLVIILRSDADVLSL